MIGYCKEDQVLSVTFLESGRTYNYTGFTLDDWNSFRSAQSLGKYYNSYIKGQYKRQK